MVKIIKAPRGYWIVLRHRRDKSSLVAYPKPKYRVTTPWALLCGVFKVTTRKGVYG